MKLPAAADVLKRSLQDKSSSGGGVLEVTVADAAAATGLPLREAEQALHALVSEHRGHLRVTEEGQILFRFPHGFDKPWETQGRFMRVVRGIGRGIEGVARFVVRAWVTIVLVFYTLVFVAILLGLIFGKEGRGGDKLAGLGLGLARLLGDALFWTFHPFSPFNVVGAVAERREQSRRRISTKPEDTTPFYEKVDRFFFGPKDVPIDPMAMSQAIVSEIRANKGRIGLADVMRVTGLPRAEVDPMMSKLMFDYDGTVDVSEEGGIAYSFPELRKTADTVPEGTRQPKIRVAKPIWEQKVKPAPITGNRAETNLLIGFLNGFNLIVSGGMLLSGLTIERLFASFEGLPPDKMPPPGTPIVLGLIPFIFSIALFALPLARLLWRRSHTRKAQRENGRRAVLQSVLTAAQTRQGVSEAELVERYRVAAGVDPSDDEITRHVVALGGDVDLEAAANGVRYRFQDLELEAKAVEAEREAASDAETNVGPVVFSSEDELLAPKRLDRIEASSATRGQEAEEEPDGARYAERQREGGRV